MRTQSPQVTPKSNPSPGVQAVNSNLEGLRSAADKDDFEDERRRQLDQLAQWQREHPESTP